MTRPNRKTWCLASGVGTLLSEQFADRKPVVGGCWLGRKDSNLQPSDPESAALPLRHSPSPSSARAGANHSKDVPVVGRLVLAGALGARAHADRQRLLRTHHLPETLLHERFRSMEVDRPTHTEHPVV